jgi:hypothetical protein
MVGRFNPISHTLFDTNAIPAAAFNALRNLLYDAVHIGVVPAIWMVV